MKALELAVLLDEMADTVDGGRPKMKDDVRRMAAAELRRLAAVETELERIKALPPVAWRSSIGNCVTLNKTIADDQNAPTWDGKPMWQPLYALWSKT